MAIVKYRNFEKKVDDNNVEFYLKQGYKLVNEKVETAETEDVVEVVETVKEKPLSKMKIDELKALAEERGIEGYESLTKTELLEVLK